MLYRTLKRMIERGQTAGLEEKIDIFFAVGKVTESEYQELIGMLNAGRYYRLIPSDLSLVTKGKSNG